MHRHRCSIDRAQRSQAPPLSPLEFLPINPAHTGDADHQVCGRHRRHRQSCACFAVPSGPDIFLVRPPRSAFLRSLIAATDARPFLPVFLHFLPSGPFFCSTSPKAFFRPDRNAMTPARAGAVKVGRRSDLATVSAASRPHLDGSEHGGRIDRSGLRTPCSLSQRGS